MSRNLIIVESPTKTKTLKKFLGRGYTIAATQGHILDLPKKQLGVDVDDGFTPVYEGIEGKEKVIATLIKEAKNAEMVYLAPDPDREGEAIAWHVARLIHEKKGLKRKPIKRLLFNEITKSAVTAALDNATELDESKYNAQQARRVLDRLVGYKVSPLLWKTMCFGLSAGRVQSVALRLVCEREDAIEAFEPVEYWSVLAELSQKGKRTKFTARLDQIGGKKAEIGDGKTAEKVRADLEAAEYAVSDVNVQTRQKRPMPPYITSTLQQDAARRLGWTPKKTMTFAQKLYEGLDIGGERGVVGLITYMRTDSVRVAKEAQDGARKYVASKYGEKYVPAKPNFYKSKGKAQDAHEAIRPTYFDLPPERVKRALTPDQFKLYKLIWERFLASQMSPASIERTSVAIDADAGKTTYLLKVGSEKVIFDGYQAVYQDLKEENGNGNGNDKTATLPKLTRGDELDCHGITPNQHFTKPPGRFSEAGLVKELEANGIGRPSTYAAIIATIEQRNYVRIDARRLIPTELGRAVNKILIEMFPDIFNVEFTAQMEEGLDKVEEGADDWKALLKRFYEPFDETLTSISGMTKQIKETMQELTDRDCPECGEHKLLVRWSRNGRFLGCSGYPKCKFTEDLGGENGGNGQQTDYKCEKCDSPMVIRTGRYGQFMACSAYPKCKNAKPIPTGVKCPESGCTGELVQRRSTKRKKIFFSCDTYPKCKYSIWDKPVPEKCPACNHAFMVEKSTKAKGDHRLCPVCKHITLMEEAAQPVAEPA